MSSDNGRIAHTNYVIPSGCIERQRATERQKRRANGGNTHGYKPQI